MISLLISDSDHATDIHILEPDDVDAFRAGRSAAEQAWMDANGFSGDLGKSLVLPGPDGGVSCVLFGWGTEKARARDRFHLAALAGRLAEGDYRVATAPASCDPAQEALGWQLSGYAFDRYAKRKGTTARLVVPEGADLGRIEAIAVGALTTQRLIDTPANDMGPQELEDAVAELASAHGATLDVTRGDALLEQNFPLIHTVGRASTRPPRLLDLTWGDTAHPKVTLVGKGVCFDTGGLNLKPGASMGLMKKDMGGAANAIGLASMVMALKLPVRLRLLIPAVENAVSGDAFRPGDIFTSRKGLTVEINNTDAEGRLVLADALALADEETPDLMLCMATLTGAARVALGPELPPFFTDDEALAGALSEAATQEADPLWRMPFWPGYEGQIEPGIADLDNAPSGGMAGAITAALFLRRFVENAASFAHFDLYGWTPAAKPARPKGGAHQGIRAMLRVIEERIA